MTVPLLNLVATQNTYVDGLTVVFTVPRPSFSLQVVRAAIYYKILMARPGMPPGAYEDFLLERVNGPVISNFSDPTHEGAPPGWTYAGVAVRSYTPNAPGLVSIF